MRSETTLLAEAGKHIFGRVASESTSGWAEVLSKATEVGPIIPPPTWLITALAKAASAGSEAGLHELLRAYDRALARKPSQKGALQAEVRKAIDFHLYVLASAGWSAIGLRPRGEKVSGELNQLLSEYRDIQIDHLSRTLHREAAHHFGGLASDQPSSWWEKYGWTSVVGVVTAILGAILGALAQAHLT
jgi:hypothetical protein